MRFGRNALTIALLLACSVGGPMPSFVDVQPRRRPHKWPARVGGSLLDESVCEECGRSALEADQSCEPR